MERTAPQGNGGIAIPGSVQKQSRCGIQLIIGLNGLGDLFQPVIL